MKRTDHWGIILRDAVIFQYLGQKGVWLIQALKKYST